MLYSDPTHTPIKPANDRNRALSATGLAHSLDSSAAGLTTEFPDPDPLGPVRSRQEHRRLYPNGIREQVSFRRQEEHLRDFWVQLAQQSDCSKSEVIKTLLLHAMQHRHPLP